MKKYTIATLVACAVALTAGAQSPTFMKDLKVGATGADVVALQTWLIANGFHIPAIESGAVAKGTFGGQTKSALIKYQKSAGLPGTGFFGPLTRGKLNGLPGMVGAIQNSNGAATAGIQQATSPAQVLPGANPEFATGFPPPGFNTLGANGIMAVTQGPLTSPTIHAGDKMVPIIAIRVQAQNSDLDLGGLVVDLGTDTRIYNKIFKKMYVTEGGRTLFSGELNSTNVVPVSTQYVWGTAGYDLLIPKGTWKDIVIKADLQPSIDSTYLNLSPWYISIDSLSVSSVDGAGVILYGPATDGLIVQGLTINSALNDTAQANVSRSGDSPLANSIPVTDTTNGQYNGLTVLKFDVNAQNDDLHLHEVKVGISTSGTGSVSAAYLYNGNTLVTSAAVSNGLADFTNITNGTAGAMIPKDTTGHFTIKVDVTGVTSNTLAVTAAAATSTFSAMTVYNSIDSTVTVAGSASGATQTIAAAGPLFTLAGTPTITKTDITAGNASQTTFQYSATFNVNVQAIGTDVDLGLPASTTAAFGTSTTGIQLAQIYDNGVATTATAVSANYSQPVNTTLSSDSSYFTVSRNQTVTVPVTYTFVVTTPAAHTYAVQLQGIQWEKGSAGSALQLTNFMRNQPSWRSATI